MATVNFAIQLIGIALIFYSFAVILFFDYEHKNKSANNHLKDYSRSLSPTWRRKVPSRE